MIAHVPTVAAVAASVTACAHVKWFADFSRGDPPSKHEDEGSAPQMARRFAAIFDGD